MQKSKRLSFQGSNVYLVISTPHEGYYLLHFQGLKILIGGCQLHRTIA